jgi:hypothetical protein
MFELVGDHMQRESRRFASRLGLRGAIRQDSRQFDDLADPSAVVFDNV